MEPTSSPTPSSTTSSTTSTAAVEVPTPSGGSSTAQIIVIIVLVVIGIVLFVILIIYTVNIPYPIIVPFSDNTFIKIKSLANNLYLKPVACQNITGCNIIPYNNSCAAGRTLVAAIGQPDDTDITWQLCQASAPATGPGSNTGEAKYVIYQQGNNGTLAMSYHLISNGNTDVGMLTVANIGSNCLVQRIAPVTCDGQPGEDFSYFSFILNEKAFGTGSTSSGSYQIIDACDTFFYMACTGQELEGCPPFVYSGQSPTIFNGDCTSIDNVDCTLTFLFEIEVV